MWSQRGMSVCVVIPFILNVRLVDAPAGVTQNFYKEDERQLITYILYTRYCTFYFYVNTQSTVKFTR